jgi:cystathionine gamma-synthase
MACKVFATSPDRKNPEGESTALSPDEISIRIFDIKVRLYAVKFPAAKAAVVQPFWTNPGVGISSRLAEEQLQHLDVLKEVTEETPKPEYKEVAAQSRLRERIAALMERSPAGPTRTAKVTADDVYLFQTGMASIYCTHQYLLSKFNSTTVLYGFAFHSTSHVFEDFGPGYEFFGLGGSEEIDKLESYLEKEKNEGRKVQAVWAEFPSNPLLVTPDIGQLRVLADKYGFVLIVDDTIGSFCNIDVLGAADIVVTSLTKSFNGFADCLAASAVLNPSSVRYAELKALYGKLYHNDLYNADAVVLEANSNDYLRRSAVLNNNAVKLAEDLYTASQDPASSISKVYYPSVSSSLSNYKPYMRLPTADFTPGYGCLFSVEFEDVEYTKVFYDNLDVHQGPHLGAHLTLAMPYTKALYGLQLEWAGKYGMRETNIRVSVGLEDTTELIETFRYALRFADALKAKKKAEGGIPLIDEPVSLV